MHTILPDRAARIAARLTEVFAPTALSVIDESAQHAGHAGAQPGGRTHYRVAMQAAAFVEHTRVSRARLVHAALADELATGLHALSLSLRAPGEPGPPD